MLTQELKDNLDEVMEIRLPREGWRQALVITRRVLELLYELGEKGKIRMFSTAQAVEALELAQWIEDALDEEEREDE